jgi:hypothetical protein
MKRAEIDWITQSLVNGHFTFEEGTDQIMELHEEHMSELKQKIKDLENWIKKDISEEVAPKLGRTMTPYRSEKIRFLEKVKQILNL